MVNKPISIHHVWPRLSRHINDNYCVSDSVPRRLNQSKETVKFFKFVLQRTGRDILNQQQTVILCQCHQIGPVSRETVKTCQTVTNVVNSVNHAHILKGQPQRKGESPVVVRQCLSLKYVNNFSHVDQLCSVQHVPNVQTVAHNLPVGAGLNQFWETLEALGAGPKVLHILKEGNTLPFPTGTSTWWRHCISLSHFK